MKANWEDAGSLAKFYAYFGKRLEIKGYWVMFGRAFCFARVIPRATRQPGDETP